MNRRHALSLLALAPVAACGLVQTTTTNGVTTVTVNVADVVAYAQAGINAASLVGSLVPGGAAIVAVGSTIAVDLAAFSKATAGQVTLTWNATSVPALVRSLLGDVQQLLADVTAAVPQVPASVASQASTYLSALSTVVTLFEALVAPASVAAAKPISMTRLQALSALGVK